MSIHLLLKVVKIAFGEGVAHHISTKNIDHRCQEYRRNPQLQPSGSQVQHRLHPTAECDGG